jgi:hypothetical protein
VQIETFPSKRLVGVRRAVEPGISGVAAGECPETDLFVRAVVLRQGESGVCRLERLRFSWMCGGRPVLSRTVEGESLDALLARGAGHLERIAMPLVPFVFGGGDVPDVDSLSRDRELGPGQAAVVMFQHFAFQTEDGVDGLRIEVDTGPHGVWTHGLSVAYPGVEDATFPVAGPAFVMASWDDVHIITHRRLQSQEFALDVVRLEDDGGIWPESPENDRFRCYGLPVLALRGGVVVRCSDGYPDNPRAGEWLPEADVAALETTHGAFSSLVGNHVILRHDDGTHSLYGHLRPGSVRVGVGDALNEGEALGEIGNSGRSGAPHLHVAVMDGPDPITAQGIPVSFRGLRNLTWHQPLRGLIRGQTAVGPSVVDADA